MPNPYTPPEVELEERHEPGSPVKAVLCALVIDIGGSLLFGIVLGLLYAALLRHSGMAEAQIDEAVDHVAPFSGIWMLGMLGGLSFTVLGGFACARISRRNDYKLGWIFGGLSALFAFLMPHESDPLVIELLLSLATIACAVAGTRLGIDRKP